MASLRHRPCSQLVVEDARSVPTLVLCPIQRGVGVADELLGDAITSGDRNADAAGHRQLNAANLERATERREQAIGATLPRCP